MKSNEIMIGDWVEYGQYITTVRSLSDKIVLSGCIGRLDEVRPVPITPEILEANGFSIDDDDWFVWEKRSGAYTLAEVKMYQDDDVWNASICGPNVCEIDDLNIRFVHELQHALRLSGIIDMADNFKIKEGGQQ